MWSPRAGRRVPGGCGFCVEQTVTHFSGLIFEGLNNIEFNCRLYDRKSIDIFKFFVTVSQYAAKKAT